MSLGRDELNKAADASLSDCHKKVGDSYESSRIYANQEKDDTKKAAALAAAKERMDNGFKACEAAHASIKKAIEALPEASPATHESPQREQCYKDAAEAVSAHLKTANEAFLKNLVIGQGMHERGEDEYVKERGVGEDELKEKLAELYKDSLVLYKDLCDACDRQYATDPGQT